MLSTASYKTMKQDYSLHTGKPEKGVVILIHGFGMNEDFWINPEKCLVLGGLAPLTIFLADTFENTDKTISFGSVNPHIRGLWQCLEAADFSLIAWSQSQPLGPIQIAIDELQIVLDIARSKWPGKPIYIIGHSRGGLVARRLLQQNSTSDIEGLVTICSPHSGTSMAKFAQYLKPAGALLQKVMPRNAKATLTKALGRLALFLQSPAIAELTPEAEFIASIQQPLPGKLRFLSFGGTSPALFQALVKLPASKHRIVKFPGLLSEIIPAGHFPGELTPGLGDGLVAAASARLPGSQHYDFPVNHVRAAYESKIHELILDFLS
jgi:pimeloyl-ACP methyl ester carboxylesterase